MCDVYEYEVVTLYYNPDHNLMMDEDGFIVFNIYDYITPSIYKLCMEKKEYMCIETSRNHFVELIFPEDDDE